MLGRRLGLYLPLSVQAVYQYRRAVLDLKQYRPLSEGGWTLSILRTTRSFFRQHLSQVYSFWIFLHFKLVLPIFVQGYHLGREGMGPVSPHVLRLWLGRGSRVALIHHPPEPPQVHVALWFETLLKRDKITDTKSGRTEGRVYIDKRLVFFLTLPKFRGQCLKTTKWWIFIFWLSHTHRTKKFSDIGNRGGVGRN